MHDYSGVLVAAGSLCLTITLVLAWCLAGARSSSLVRRLFPGVLLMTGLLMIFYLLFAHFRLSVSPFILAAMSFGSLMNPVGFLALAVKPDIRQQPATPFGVVMMVSFTLTTIGYAGAAWHVAHAAVLAL